VVRILDFGAFVEILPNKDGMVHISELADHHVEKVEDVVKIGDKIKVKVIKIDEMNRVNLSMKQANPDYKPQAGRFNDRSNDKNDRRPPRRGGFVKR